MKNAENLVAVHTHTHTHTINLKTVIINIDVIKLCSLSVLCSTD